MKIKELKINKKNPRKITDVQLNRLKKSLKEFRKMLKYRPIIIDTDNNVIAGNMRLRALTEMGVKELQTGEYRLAEDLSEDEIKRFIIEDNISAGDWDKELLQLEFSEFDIPEINWDEPLASIEEKELEPYEKVHYLISMSPELLIKAKKFIEGLKNIEGVEIEYGKN